jgi:hypothetical protein
MFMMNTSSQLFRNIVDLTNIGAQREGADWLLPNGTRMVPLYEAKMIHQFDHRWATFEAGDSRDSAEVEKQNPNFDPVPRYWVPEPVLSLRTGLKTG